MSTGANSGSGVQRSRPTRGSGGRPATPAPSSGGGAASRDPTPSSGAAVDSRAPSPSESTPAEGDTTDVVEIDDDDTKPGNKRRKSNVWEEFTEEKVGGVLKAECNWCHKLLSGATRHGTSHLHGHLRICESRNIKKKA